MREITALFRQVRAGATLLFDSRPEAEEAETELKASAMRDAVLRADPPPAPTIPRELANSATSQARELCSRWAPRLAA